MTDGTLTPDQQAAADHAAKVALAAKVLAETPGQPAQTPSTPDGYVEVARFNGLMQRNEALTAQLTEATGNLATRSSSLEQSKKELVDQAAAQEVQVGENTLKVTELTEQVSTLTAANLDYNSLQLKLKVANELGRPDLMALAQHIPNSTDEAVIKDALTAFAGFSDGAVKKREDQLLSGVSPAGSAGGVAPKAPTTPQGWADYVNTFPLGTKEREAALKAFGQAVTDNS